MPSLEINFEQITVIKGEIKRKLAKKEYNREKNKQILFREKKGARGGGDLTGISPSLQTVFYLLLIFVVVFIRVIKKKHYTQNA